MPVSQPRDVIDNRRQQQPPASEEIEGSEGSFDDRTALYSKSEMTKGKP